MVAGRDISGGGMYLWVARFADSKEGVGDKKI
jgi:hypothetical protein